MSALVSFEPYVDHCTDLFEQVLLRRAQTGVSFDFGHWLQCYAFDVIGHITFGKRFGFLDNGEDIGGLITALDDSFLPSIVLGLFPNLYYYIFRLQGLLTRYAGQKSTGTQYLLQFAQEAIEECKKSYQISSVDENAKEPMLWKSFRKHKEDPKRFTEYHIFATCFMNIAAGSDTTGISLSAIFYYLLTNPETLKKLRSEVEEKQELGQLSERPSFEESQNMPYLQAVIKEALRMHPAVGLPLERLVPKDGAAIAGQFFPEGVSGMVASDFLVSG
jgi:cytochrome P450